MGSTFKKRLLEVGYIVFKNVVLLVNGIIFTVVVLLFIFGDRQAALFIGLVLLLNMVLGIAQDLRAWYALEKLQSLTAPKATRINPDATEEEVWAEQIKKGDLIKLKIGDQVPCDGIVVEAKHFEVNQGLITGESDSLTKSKGADLLAGSVVTAGFGQLKSYTAFNESRIARMTARIKTYGISSSPIQKSVEKIITYTAYLSVAAMTFVIVRGFLVHEPILRIIKVVGTVASMFVPQGLVFAVTLFFAYGAAHLFKRQVLLQEVNATEKLGRIKNLCMDKTGTLTKNELVVEDIFISPDITKSQAETWVEAYVQGSSDSSGLILAVKKFLRADFAGEILETLGFSSWRGYGAVRVRDGKKIGVIFAGLPNHFLAYLSGEEQRWLKKIIDVHAHLGKRILSFVWADATNIPKNLSQVKLSILAAVVFHNELREGIGDTINFFQKRGVNIRIVSGDNAQTTRAVSAAAGINGSDKVITGKALEKWNEVDFENNVGSFAVFAEIMPEQKEKIIAAFKKSGFTAMVGDGANDALAIKKADLGIAMFDGAPATRNLASVVLTNNSFAALPGGVTLADGIIRNIEIFGAIFVNLTLMGIFFFIIIAALGYEYPLTPLNITFINYFTIGIPGILLSYWTIRPSDRVQPADERSFLKRVLPFTAVSAIIQALGAAIIFSFSPLYLKTAESNTLVVLSFIVFGFLFFVLAPKVYRVVLTKAQKIQLAVWAILETLLLLFAFRVPVVLLFFNITLLQASSPTLLEVILVALATCYLQYWLAKRYVIISLKT